MDTLRNNYIYLEKAIPFTDSQILITVYKPEYGKHYRDVYIFSNQGQLCDSIIKWRCTKQKNGLIQKNENYYTVDLLNSFWCQPIFWDGKIFKTSRLPYVNITGKKLLDINKELYSTYGKNNKKWYLFEYVLLH